MGKAGRARKIDILRHVAARAQRGAGARRTSPSAATYLPPHARPREQGARAQRSASKRDDGKALVRRPRHGAPAHWRRCGVAWPTSAREPADMVHAPSCCLIIDGGTFKRTTILGPGVLSPPAHRGSRARGFSSMTRPRIARSLKLYSRATPTTHAGGGPAGAHSPLGLAGRWVTWAMAAHEGGQDPLNWVLLPARPLVAVHRRSPLRGISVLC